MSRNTQNKDQRRPSTQRGASGAWNRLKPVSIDPLDVYGLPSKGEKRLHNFKVQEEFYSRIVDRYMKFCASFSDGEQLDNAFASLRISAASASTGLKPGTGGRDAPTKQSSNSEADQRHEMAVITMAMRKLREGFLGSRRRDIFAQRAYMFIIHASILARHWESYHPALRYLLHEIHPVNALSKPDLQEFSSYHILDLACRQNKLLDAYTAKNRFENRDRKVAAVLASLSHDNWIRYWRSLHAVDGYHRAIMEFQNERMRLHVLKCIGQAYLHADKAFIEQSTDTSWSDLVKQGVGWELQPDGKVIIRKPKAR